MVRPMYVNVTYGKQSGLLHWKSNFNSVILHESFSCSKHPCWYSLGFKHASKIFFSVA